jgi:hypothetical protein
MTETAPLTFTDEQLLEALKAAPAEVQGHVAVIAMQLELSAHRANATEQD